VVHHEAATGKELKAYGTLLHSVSRAAWQQLGKN